LRRDRLIVGTSLAVAIAVAWAYLVPAGRGMYGPMDGWSAWMMTATCDRQYFALVVKQTLMRARRTASAPQGT
jgi:hypothetical protein